MGMNTPMFRKLMNTSQFITMFTIIRAWTTPQSVLLRAVGLSCWETVFMPLVMVCWLLVPLW